MKTTKEQFELFKKTFLECVDKWKITGWKLYFEHTKIESLAHIETNIDAYSATVRFSSDVDKDDFTHFSDSNIEFFARHECAHLLIARVALVGAVRFVVESEHQHAEEELVNHLTELLP